MKCSRWGSSLPDEFATETGDPKTTDKEKPKHSLPEPRAITLPEKDFQPGKADMEAEYDMPGAAPDAIRSAVFRPFKIEREDPDR